MGGGFLTMFGAARQGVPMGETSGMVLRAVVLSAVCVWLAVATGCGMNAPLAYMEPTDDVGLVPTLRRVAVVPFHNVTDKADAGVVLTNAFVAALARSGRYQVEFPGNVKEFLVSERVVVRTGMDLETVRRMGARLDVDGVMLGEVEAYYGSDEQHRNVVPEVEVSARMLDARNGRVLFMARHRRTGRDYVSVLDVGQVRSVGALARRVSQEMLDAMVW